MSYKIILDSCGELPETYKKDARFELVPLGLEVGDYRIQDDEHFNQAEFLRKVAEYPGCPKSSCPSPERFLESYCCEAENIYVVTLSSNLSGSYNSAELAKKLYEEQYGKKNICVVDSCSASCGESQIAFEAMRLEEEGLPFEEITAKLTQFRDAMNTYFILDNLETLRKNGRLSGVKALVATTLSIKPVMGATPEGTIIQLGQAIGMKKGLQKMAETLANEAVHPEEKCLMITHCNAKARAEAFRDMVLEKIKVKDVLIMDTAGISSMYANDGGVIATI
ncbi:MAG: DegV family protein [Lachnospiraceae bacterium]|nr:DegV family protein [Lachnospiraceae bacterium]